MQRSLSDSQRHLIRLFARGYTDGEIARTMALSPEQLQIAFSNICRQLQVADRIELLLMMWAATGRAQGQVSKQAERL
ncbi:MAG TPA: LuxR C-terminal-related transcriptional regulator [Terriglobales bacterium]|nr:LuxR C-terminal-related transcriptional regulator [Terriglobales bacterium]